MTKVKAQACTTSVYRMEASKRNVGIIFLTLGLMLWVAIWAQTIQGTRQASVVDMTFPVLLTATSLAFTMRVRRTGAEPQDRV